MFELKIDLSELRQLADDLGVCRDQIPHAGARVLNDATFITPRRARARCTSIIAPRRRRDASDNIERMAIAMSGCLPSGQVCRGRKPFGFDNASAFRDPTIAAKPLISLGPSAIARDPRSRAPARGVQSAPRILT
jgi:hypothetical protein